MALHPDVARLLEDLRAAGVPAVSDGSPVAARERLRTTRAARTDTGPAMRRVRDESIGSAGAGLVVRVYDPVDDPTASILYFHGGGWVVGDLETSDFAARHLAAATSAQVVSVGYRLAPEHPYPAAVHDAHHALQWLTELLATGVADSSRVFVAGDSAGGNLAAVTALRSRDAGGPEIAGQILLYPVVDCDLHTSSYQRFAAGFSISRRDMLWFWDHYVPDETARIHPHISPLHAETHAGLPPTFVAIADHDVLMDEGEAYVRRLEASGVPVVHRRYDGTIHGFFPLPDRLEPARELLIDIGRFVEELSSSPLGGGAGAKKRL